MKFLLLSVFLTSCAYSIEWNDVQCWRWCDHRRDRDRGEWVHKAGRDRTGHCVCDWEVPRGDRTSDWENDPRDRSREETK